MFGMEQKVALLFDLFVLSRKIGGENPDFEQSRCKKHTKCSTTPLLRVHVRDAELHTRRRLLQQHLLLVPQRPRERDGAVGALAARVQRQRLHLDRDE